MYESPVTIVINQLCQEMTQRREDMIFTQVTEQLGVHVDKDELIRALQYDRNQYEKGYADAMAVLEDIKSEIREWYWQADKQSIAQDPCVVDAMVDLFIRTIDKHCGRGQV